MWTKRSLSHTSKYALNLQWSLCGVAHRGDEWQVSPAIGIPEPKMESRRSGPQSETFQTTTGRLKLSSARIPDM